MTGAVGPRETLTSNGSERHNNKTASYSSAGSSVSSGCSSAQQCDSFRGLRSSIQKKLLEKHRRTKSVILRCIKRLIRTIICRRCLMSCSHLPLEDSALISSLLRDRWTRDILVVHLGRRQN